MRLAYPSITDCGLGNNLITVAKAYSIAERCKLQYQPPVWPPNQHIKPATRNGYGYYFPTTLADQARVTFFSYQLRLQNKLSTRLWPPVIYFRRQDYGATGVTDVGEACLKHLRTLGLDESDRSLVVTTSGMWGGYAGIKQARDWLLQLLLSHSATFTRLEEFEERLAKPKLRVAVQIRMGDFRPRDSSDPIVPGERVVRLPLEWYARVCRLIRETCDCEFVLVTDGTRDELSDFMEEFRPANIIGEPYQDLLGLLLLSRSDLVICSNSTYSRLGCFLNDKPYIWPADTLIKSSTGQYGYLFNNPLNEQPNGHRPDADGVRRCFAMSVEFRDLPPGLRRYLESRGSAPIEIADDLLYYQPAAVY